MLKGLGNLASLVKNAQEMQGRIGEVQEDLGRIRVEGIAGGGMIKVEANGQQKIVGCHIEASLIEAGDQEMIEDLFVAAANSALDKAKEAATQEMSKIAGEIDIPGLGNALSKFGLGGNPAE